MMLGYCPSKPSEDRCLSSIPRYAQISTKPYAIFLSLRIRKVPINDPTSKIMFVQTKSAIPNPFQLILTKNTVILAMAATVIQPKYTLKGMEINSFSSDVIFSTRRISAILIRIISYASNQVFGHLTD